MARIYQPEPPPGKKRADLKRTLLWSGVTAILSFVILCVGALGYVGLVANRIGERMSQLRAAHASTFYALYPPLKLKQKFTAAELQGFLTDQGYVDKGTADGLLPGEYHIDKGTLTILSLNRSSFKGAGRPLEAMRARLTFEPVGPELTLTTITRLDNNESVETLESIPKKIGSFSAGRLRTQDPVALSDIPTSMRMAVMAIEDVHFLEHSGVSFKGTARALWKDIVARKWAEGGSTLTQQLMKNLFFTREKAVSRKFKEAMFAFVTEWRHTKEEILEGYLNEIYLGQWGTHEIHGVSEGAGIYFNRPISQLSLSQSATLAAIIQAPNAQDPHRYPERTLKRRNLVLKKMLDAEFILPDEYQMAIAEPLGVVPAERSLNNADYFTDLVMDRLPADIKGRLDKDALTVYVTLNPYLQELAGKLLNANLERLRKNFPAIRKKEAKGRHLESALIAIDVKDCTVIALQGGHSYRQTQFNRVLQGKRQPGSLFKPFVFLSAFVQSTPETPYTALTEFEDSPFEWKYDKQVWKPKNYEPEFRGKVTIREALEHSINTPTARVTQKIGVPAILDSLTKAGIRSTLPPVPSIALGSAEVTPLEMAEAYTTLANIGKYCALRPYLQVFDENRNHVVDSPNVQAPALPPGPTYQTVHLMKGVV